MNAPAPTSRVDLAPCAWDEVERLVAVLGISRTFAQVLVRRGLADPGEARTFLAGADHHPPAAFAGMKDAVDLLLLHVDSGTRITVHGDYDVDGICSTAILVEALRALGGDVDWFIPSRSDDGYGLSVATVERLAARGTALLVTVDCGITAVDEVARGRALGLDVLVTDHHRPRADGVLPDAPIVHPRVSGYPCGDLCAAGVAHKLVAALGTATGRGDDLARASLDLVALATTCDLVPLHGENRRLVREGLRALGATRRAGLRELMRVAKVDPSGIDASALGFRLGPRLNAAGRLARADSGVELLLTGDEERARRIAAELDALNAERRAVEQRVLWSAEAQVAEQGERPAYVLAGEGWHPGVVGIVASRIAERHHRPAVLIALPPEGSPGELATGSGRSIPAFDLLAGLEASSSALTRYGGHRAAAGLSLAPGAVAEFRAAFEDHARATLRPEDLVPRRRVDAVVPGAALGLGLAEELARLEPCGMGNPSPALLVPAARCADPRTMGEDGQHLRFSVEAGGARARAVLFRCGGRLPVEAGEPCDLVVELEAREWNGAAEPRLLLRAAAPVAPHPIEVLGARSPDPWLPWTLALATAPAVPAGRGEGPPAARMALDRRDDAEAAVLAALAATGEPVLAVVADVPRRLPGLAQRLGGFTVASWAEVDRQPARVASFLHVVALDPPASGTAVAGAGWLHLTYGPAQVEFARAVLRHEHDLRAQLAELFRALRHGGRLAGAELESALRGAGVVPRAPEHAARLVRVLADLRLARLDPAGAALELGSTERTDLDRSLAFQQSRRALAEGERHLEEALRPAPVPLVAAA